MTDQILSFKKEFKKRGTDFVIEINLEENYLDIYNDGEWFYGIELFDSQGIFEDPASNVKIDRFMKHGMYVFHELKGKIYGSFLTAPTVAEKIFTIVFEKANIADETVKEDYYHEYLEFHGVSSKAKPIDKWWEVTVKGNEYMARWGRIGSKGSKQSKTFGSAYEAKIHAKNLVRIKLKGDYNRV